MVAGRSGVSLIAIQYRIEGSGCNGKQKQKDTGGYSGPNSLITDKTDLSIGGEPLCGRSIPVLRCTIGFAGQRLHTFRYTDQKNAVRADGGGDQRIGADGKFSVMQACNIMIEN